MPSYIDFQPSATTKAISDVSASYTRPSDTTAYAISDSLSNSTSAPTALTFSNTARFNGGGGYLVNAICSTNQTTFAGEIRLHLFKGSSATTAINDNAAYTLLSANNTIRVGYIDFTVFETGGGGSDIANGIGEFPQGRIIPFSCDVSNANLYGLVEVRTAFTPASAQTFSFYLGVEQN